MQESHARPRGSTSRIRGLLLFACLMVMAAPQCTLLGSSSEAERTSALAEVNHFAVYFADRWQEALTGYDMAIVDPDAYGPAAVDRLIRAETLPIGYVNIGEAETYRSYFSQVDSSWILRANPNWEDHYYIDVREDGWQALLLHHVIPNIMDRGYQGLFLDMVDTALPGLYPNTKPGMIELIQRIRETFPDALLIMNNGLFLGEDVEQWLDGVVAENVLTRYNFEADTYERTPEREQQSSIRSLRDFHDRYGLEIFLLNYAGAEDRALEAYAQQHARGLDLRSFTSIVELDTVPMQPFQ